MEKTKKRDAVVHCIPQTLITKLIPLQITGYRIPIGRFQ